jgi:hypothetical protein
MQPRADERSFRGDLKESGTKSIPLVICTPMALEIDRCEFANGVRSFLAKA